jgi:hypothetical protein
VLCQLEREPILRWDSTPSTVLAVVFGEKSCVNVTRSTSGSDEQEEES